jgi:hypothetical protein
MELLTSGFLDVLLTVLSVSLVVTIIIWGSSALVGLKSKTTAIVFIAVFAFSMLGFVTGSIMSDSREPAVSAVLPAALTLMGGIAAFQIGSKGIETQLVVCVLILAFSLALYIGSFYGAQVGAANDLYAKPAIDAENNRFAVDLQRLDNYVQLLKQKKLYEKQDSVDLSRFESILEGKGNKPSDQKNEPIK